MKHLAPFYMPLSEMNYACGFRLWHLISYCKPENVRLKANDFVWKTFHKGEDNAGISEVEIPIQFN